MVAFCGLRIASPRDSGPNADRLLYSVVRVRHPILICDTPCRCANDKVLLRKDTESQRWTVYRRLVGFQFFATKT